MRNARRACSAEIHSYARASDGLGHFGGKPCGMKKHDRYVVRKAKVSGINDSASFLTYSFACVVVHVAAEACADWYDCVVPRFAALPEFLSACGHYSCIPSHFEYCIT
jgi:hypothetical protein